MNKDLLDYVENVNDVMTVKKEPGKFSLKHHLDKELKMFGKRNSFDDTTLLNDYSYYYTNRSQSLEN